ncbi:MAG TPA: GNAT family protein [Solirubrobacteraceae bacterium]|nr:GNAT family protein [Solirubrobacteraceae bacterium]
MLAFPEPPPTLADRTAALRLAAERDIPETLIAHQDDPALARALGLRRPPSASELGRRAERSAAERAAGRELWLTVLAAGATDECLGQLDVHDVEPEDARASLTIWIAPGRRRRGLGSAALALAGRWLIEEVGLARLQMFADPRDRAIRGAALRAGFRPEGVLRGYRAGLGRAGFRVDAAVFSLVAADLGAR